MIARLKGFLAQRAAAHMLRSLPSPEDMTREPHAEELQGARERYRALWDHAGVGLYVHDLAGRFMVANDAALQMLGRERTEVHTLSFGDILDGQGMATAMQTMSELLHTGHARTPETYCLRHRDGHTVWLETEVALLYREGQPYAVQGIVRDITERKVAEARLNHYQDSLRTLNQFALDLSLLPPDGDLPALVAMSLIALTGAPGVVFNTYDAEKRCLEVSYVHARSETANRLKGFLGRNLIGLRSPVSAETLQSMAARVVGHESNLHDLSFGAIPKPVALAVNAFFGWDRYVGLALMVEGALMGAVTFVLGASQAETSEDVLRAFAHLAAAALRNHSAQRLLYEYREHLEDQVAERTTQLQTLNDALRQQIRQREAAQEQLAQSEQRFRHLVEQQGEGVGIVDPEERFIFANPAAEQIFGVAAGGLIGRTLKEFTSAEQFALIRKQTERRRAGEPGAYEMEIVRPGGDRRDLLVTVRPHIEGQGQFRGAFGVFRDITERADAERRRAQAEEALRRAHDELEVRVQARTTELAGANAALQSEIGERTRAEEQLRTSLTEKEVLLKEIHHRVKNNLQIISSLLSLQATHLQEPQVLAMFAESEHRVRSMALIHEKLYRSHDLARINFREYAEDLLTYLHRSYAGAWGRIALRVEAEDVLLAVGSAVPCGLILNELVSNCFKHAFPGGREGSVRVAIHANGDGKVHFSVTDDGIGLPEGFNIAETPSLGMQLVSTLAEQLGAELTMTGEQGTTVAWAFGI